jgi:hypothetical protein
MDGINFGRYRLWTVGILDGENTGRRRARESGGDIWTVFLFVTVEEGSGGEFKKVNEIAFVFFLLTNYYYTFWY